MGLQSQKLAWTRTAVALGEPPATVVQTTETASSNGHGTVAQVDAVTVEEAVAGKVLETAAFMEVTATDVPGAVSMFSLTFVEAADDAKCIKECQTQSVCYKPCGGF